MDFGAVLLDVLRALLAATVIVALGFAPIIWLLRKQFSRLEDPANLLLHGVVVCRKEALDGVADCIGRYRDSDIYRYVTFKGMRYDFERVVPLPRSFQVGPRELFVEPGIVYVAHA
jgi:hypothetical protein